MSDITQKEKEKQLTHNYMPRLLSYVKRDEGFTNLIRGLESYISYAGGVLEYSIDEHNQPAQSINENTDIAYLERLVNLLGVSLDYFPSDYFNNPTEQQLKDLRELYLLAIRGAVINRTGDATKQKLLSALQNMYRDADITIIDGGMPNNDPSNDPGKMNIVVNIQGVTTNMDSAVLTLYLRQNITGVGEQFNFDVTGVGVWSPVNTLLVSEGQSVDTMAELSTPQQLDSYFSSVDADKPYGYEDTDEKKYGMGGYLFSNVKSSGSGDNNFEDVITIIPFPPTGTNRTYLGTAMWMIQLI